MAEDEKFIETFDEDGNKVIFELVDIITVEDVEYALLLPKENPKDDDEVLVMRLRKDGEDFSFEEIEDDEEFDKVAAYIDELEDEIDDDE